MMVRLERFELPAFWFVARRSIQLSYRRADLILPERRQPGVWRSLDRLGQNLRMGLAARRVDMWFRQVLMQRLVFAAKPLIYPVAAWWRRMLFRTTFIAITGSAGKTTAKELLAAIMATRGRTYKTRGNQNGPIQVALNLLRVRPWHRFAVIEIGIDMPGRMVLPAHAVRPDIAVVLNVLKEHTKGFPDLDRYAAEKTVLLPHVVPGGVAVLNGEDSRVAAMAAGGRFRVRTFGSSPAFDYWVEGASAAWPERLRLEVHSRREGRQFETQLLGVHWTPSILAAVAAAGEAGVGLDQAAAAVRSVRPYTARLDPVPLPGGSVIVRDDYGSSMESLALALRFLREARAGRRILVTSDFSDADMNFRGRFKFLGAAVSSWLELLVVIGHNHAYGRRKAIEAGMPTGNVCGFEGLREAAAFLKSELREGDLVLLKGRTTDHLARLFFAQIGAVGCWQAYCRKTMLCDGCWKLGFHPDGSFVPLSAGRRV